MESAERTAERILAEPAHRDAVEKLLARVAAADAQPVLLTSTGHGEGTSTLSWALARILASHGGPVALAQLHVRVAGTDGAAGVPGAAQLARGEAEVEDVVGAPDPSGVRLVASGGPANVPPERLARAVASLVEWSERTGHALVVDAPPVNPYPETPLLARAAGACALVVRAGGPRREAVDAAREALERSGARLLGAILNRRAFVVPDWLYRRI